MKSSIHPEYSEVLVTCACGESFKTRSTTGELRLEICSKCHPFFTGKQKLIDTAGRVERFRRRYRSAGKSAADRDRDDAAADRDRAGAAGEGDSGTTAPAPRS